MIMNSILGFEAGAVGKKSADPSQGAEKTTNFSDFTDALAASDSAEAAVAVSVEADTPPSDSSLPAQGDSSQEREGSAELEVEAEAALTPEEEEFSLVELPDALETKEAEANAVPVVQVATRSSLDAAREGQDIKPATDAGVTNSSLAPEKTAQEADLISTGSRSAPGVEPEKATPAAADEVQKNTETNTASMKPTGESAAAQSSETRSPMQPSGQSAFLSEQAAVKADQVAASMTNGGRRQAGASRSAGVDATMVNVPAAPHANAEAVAQVVQQASGAAPVVTDQAAMATSQAAVAAVQVQTDSSERQKASPRAGVSHETLAARGMPTGHTVPVVPTPAATGNVKNEIVQAISEPRDVEAASDAEVSVARGKSETSAKSPYDVRVTGAMPQQPALFTAMSQLSQTAGANTFAGLDTGAFSNTIEMTNEMPGLSQLLTEATIGTSAAHRAELPRMVATQMAEAFAAKGEQKVEISLNPQELGRVSMRVVTSETGITMVIQAERPETGDLMRRHIHELAEEFREMGYEDISFEFSGGQADGGQSQDQSGSSSANADALHGAAIAEPATQNLQLGAAGVDMRV